MARYRVMHSVEGMEGFTMNGKTARNWREAIKKATPILGIGSYRVEFFDYMGSNPTWCVTRLLPKTSPKCLQCNGLMHVIPMINQFWCPVCEPDGLPE